MKATKRHVPKDTLNGLERAHDVLSTLQLSGFIGFLITVLSFPFAMRGEVSWQHMYDLAIFTGATAIIVSVFGIIVNIIEFVHTIYKYFQRRKKHKASLLLGIDPVDILDEDTFNSDSRTPDVNNETMLPLVSLSQNIISSNKMTVPYCD